VISLVKGFIKGHNCITLDTVSTNVLIAQIHVDNLLICWVLKFNDLSFVRSSVISSFICGKIVQNTSIGFFVASHATIAGNACQTVSAILFHKVCRSHSQIACIAAFCSFISWTSFNRGL
jgi:hypothetical protein